MGIYLRGKNWYIDYYVKERRKWKKVGPSKKLAEQVLKDIHVKIARGEYLGIYEEKKDLFDAHLWRMGYQLKPEKELISVSS